MNGNTKPNQVSFEYFEALKNAIVELLDSKKLLC